MALNDIGSTMRVATYVLISLGTIGWAVLTALALGRHSTTAHSDLGPPALSIAALLLFPIGTLWLRSRGFRVLALIFASVSTLISVGIVALGAWLLIGLAGL